MKRSLSGLLSILMAMILVSAPDSILLAHRFGRWLSQETHPLAGVTLPFRYATLVFKPAPGHLPVPVEGVSTSSLNDSFGVPRPGRRKHHGTDIFARRNTPVRSTTDGIIIRRGTDALGGLIVSVAGPGGQFHYYAHLEKYGSFKLSDFVKSGDIIGYVGNSGNARTTPPHLHYGIYSPGGVINPYPLLATEKLKAMRSKRAGKPISSG